MPRLLSYESAADAIVVSKLASAGRLIAVDGTLTTNGDGFVICDAHEPAKLWDANGHEWQARVHCSLEPRVTSTGTVITPGKYKLIMERWGTNAL